MQCPRNTQHHDNNISSAVQVNDGPNSSQWLAFNKGHSDTTNPKTVVHRTAIHLETVDEYDNEAGMPKIPYVLTTFCIESAAACKNVIA